MAAYLSFRVPNKRLPEWVMCIHQEGPGTMGMSVKPWAEDIKEAERFQSQPSIWQKEQNKKQCGKSHRESGLAN